MTDLKNSENVRKILEKFELFFENFHKNIVKFEHFHHDLQQTKFW